MESTEQDIDDFIQQLKDYKKERKGQKYGYQTAVVSDLCGGLGIVLGGTVTLNLKSEHVTMINRKLP